MPVSPNYLGEEAYTFFCFFSSQICRRSYLEACVNGPLVGFLKCIGFKKDFEFLAEGEVYVRGRAKVLIYAVFEVDYPNSGDMQMSVSW